MSKKVKRVVIGSSIYEIIHTGKPILVQGENCYGSQHYTPRKIHITTEKNVAQQEKEETTLHEILHAINDDRNLDLNHDQVKGVSKGIFQVLRDNKKLFKAFTFGL